MTDDSLVEKVKAQLEIEKREQSDSNGSKDQPDTEKGGQRETEEITTSPDGRQVSEGNDGDNREARDRNDAAALVLQRNYRGYQVRNKMKGVQLDKDDRWDELLKQTNHKTDERSALENQNDPKTRWRRGVNAATRLQTGVGLYSPKSEDKPINEKTGPSADESASAPKQGEEELGDDTSLDHDPKAKEKRRKHKKASLLGVLSMGVGKGDGGRGETEPLPYTSKGLEEQHWLEMLDGKHRYGSNLKFYFRAWKKSDTKDNFFRWLDRGEGKDLSLPELAREQLEKERITYLSAEQRLNYLVRIGYDGLLRWAHNGERVDTSPGKWKDGGDGRGIVPIDAEGSGEAEDEPSASGMDTDSLSSSPSSSSLSASNLQDEQGTHYAGNENQGWLQRKTAAFTPAGMAQNLLRKTVRKNTWIYVSDMKFNLFIGIKTSGTFQHSSFLSGGKVTSAGLIVVKNGLIKNISPLSGHYRSSIEHYKAFIARMEDMGADLSRVKVGKSVAVLWGLSHYGRATKAKSRFTHDLKEKLHISNEKTEQEKSDELRKHAEEDRKNKKGDTKLMETFRRNVLYGRSSSQTAESDESEEAEATTSNAKDSSSLPVPTSGSERQHD